MIIRIKLIISNLHTSTLSITLKIQIFTMSETNFIHMLI